MGAWILDTTYTYSGNVAEGATIADGLTSTTSDWYVASGVLRRNRTYNSDLDAGARTLATSMPGVRRRVRLTTAPLGPITSTGAGNPQGVGFYIAGYAVVGNYTVGSALANNGLHPQVSTGSGTGATTPFTPTQGQSYIFDTQESAHGDDGSVSLHCYLYNTAAPTTLLYEGTYSGLAGVTQSKAAFSLAVDPIDKGSVGITKVEIFHWDENATPPNPLTLVSGTGYASVSGTTVSCAAPVVSGGQGTINWQWKYYSPITNATGVAISGASGTGTPLALSWNVPAQYQNADGWVACDISDGTTAFIGVGYDLTYYDSTHNVGATGIYTPFYAPAPLLPTDAELSAVIAQIAIPTGQKAIIGRLGDSITEQQIPVGQTELMQAKLDTLAPSKFTVVNAGHSSASLLDWLRSAPATGLGQSKLAGQSANNNFTGLINVLSGLSGPKIVSSFLLTNAGGTLTDYNNLASDVQSATYGIDNVPMVFHQLLYRRNYFNSVVSDFLAQNDTIINLVPDASTSDRRFRGNPGTHPWFMNHLGEFADPGHPNDGGKDSLCRLHLLPILQTMAAVYPVSIPPTLTALTVSIGAPGQDGKRQASATPMPSGASISAGVWSLVGGGSIAVNGLITLPAQTSQVQTLTATYTVGSGSGAIAGSATITVPALTPSPSGAVVDRFVRGPLVVEFNYADDVFFVGDICPVILVLRQGNGEVVPISEGTPVLVTVSGNGETLTEDEPADIEYGPGGLIRYQLQEADTAEAGRKSLYVSMGDESGRQSWGPLSLNVRSLN